MSPNESSCKRPYVQDDSDTAPVEEAHTRAALVAPTDTPKWVAVVKVTGEDVEDIIRRLEDAAFGIEESLHKAIERGGTLNGHERIGGRSIVTMRQEQDAPVVDWREDRGSLHRNRGCPDEQAVARCCSASGDRHTPLCPVDGSYARRFRDADAQAGASLVEPSSTPPGGDEGV